MKILVASFGPMSSLAGRGNRLTHLKTFKKLFPIIALEKD
jgi:hypothetical protein